jgi:tetratricopeptide (TPR) repeat protein
MPEAIALLEHTLEDQSTEPRVHAAALYALGRALHAYERPGEAARRFLELARLHPTDPEARDAIEVAVAIAYARHRDDGTGGDLLREALVVLLARFDDLPTVDRWRYIAGRLAIEDGAYEEAVAHFGRIPPASARWLDARFMEANALRTAALAEQDVGRRIEASRRVVQVAQQARAVMEATVGDVDPARAADLEYYATHLRIFEARAQLELGAPEQALTPLEGIENEPEVDAGMLASALRIRVEAYGALGRVEDKGREIERYLAAAPDRAEVVLGSMLRNLLAEAELLIEGGQDDAARDLARQEGVPLATTLDRWLQSAGVDPGRRSTLLNRAAKVYRIAGRYDDALRLYNRLSRARPNAMEVIFGRAECLYGLGGDERYAEAIVLFKRLVDAGPSIGTEYYWQSQVRVLQILDKVQRNTAGIVPRIQRLRLQTPDLGGERFRRQFERLESKYL